MPTLAEVKKMKVAELKDELTALGLSTDGKKDAHEWGASLLPSFFTREWSMMRQSPDAHVFCARSSYVGFHLYETNIEPEKRNVHVSTPNMHSAHTKH